MLLENRAEILEAYEEVIEALTDISNLYAEQEQLQSEIEIVVEMIRRKTFIVGNIAWTWYFKLGGVHTLLEYM